MHQVGKDKGLLGLESAGNDILGVLARELDALLQLQVGLEQELFVIYRNTRHKTCFRLVIDRILLSAFAK
jgi:hypothetical protein